MKTIKKNFLAGIGRTLGVLFIYGTLALGLYVSGIKIDLSDYPPTLVGEITQTINHKQ